MGQADHGGAAACRSASIDSRSSPSWRRLVIRPDSCAEPSGAISARIWLNSARPAPVVDVGRTAAGVHRGGADRTVSNSDVQSAQRPVPTGHGLQAKGSAEINNDKCNVSIGHSLMAAVDAHTLHHIGAIANARRIDQPDGDAFQRNVSETCRGWCRAQRTMARGRRAEGALGMGRPTMASVRPSWMSFPKRKVSAR